MPLSSVYGRAGRMAPAQWRVQPRQMAQPMAAQPAAPSSSLMLPAGAAGGRFNTVQGFRNTLGRASSGPQFDPSDPYGFLAGAQGANWPSVISRLVGQAGQEGYFSPQGQTRLREARRRRILGNEASRNRRSEILSRLLGLDPQQARFAMLEGQRAADADTFNALNAGDLEDEMANRDFYRNLLNTVYGVDVGNYRQSQEGAVQERMARGQGGGLGGFLGQAGGALLGGYLARRR